MSPAAPTTIDEIDVERIRHAYDAGYDALVTDLSWSTTDRWAAVSSADEAFVSALRRPSAFRYHDDPSAWLHSKALKHLQPPRPGDLGGRTVSVHTSSAPFPDLLARARRSNRRRLVATLAIALGALALVVVWFSASGVAFEPVGRIL